MPTNADEAIAAAAVEFRTDAWKLIAARRWEVESSWGGVMTRKGEFTRAVIERRWPHRVELLAEAVRGKENTAATWELAQALGGAPIPLSDFHDDRHFAVFHFKTAEAAKAFHARFGGELLPLDEPRRR